MTFVIASLWLIKDSQESVPEDYSLGSVQVVLQATASVLSVIFVLRGEEKLNYLFTGLVLHFFGEVCGVVVWMGESHKTSHIMLALLWLYLWAVAAYEVRRLKNLP